MLQSGVQESTGAFYEKIWIISGGREKDIDLSEVCSEPIKGPVTEYDISALSQYLLNPNKITLREKVVGCRIYYRQTGGLIRRLMRRLTSSGPEEVSEEVVSPSRIAAPDFDDRHLNAHLNKIRSMLRQYDPVYRKLSTIDRNRIDNITAVCEDPGKNRHQLNLQGGIAEKIDYVLDSLGREVNVSFNRAYLMNGLFEMRGFNFRTYRPERMYRLLKVDKNGSERYCVLNPDYRLLYWVDDNAVIQYLHILDQSIRNDRNLREALEMCVRGEARPLKLFFSKQREPGYTENFLPRLYREAVNALNVGPDVLRTITQVINNGQSIVSFNYIPNSPDGRQKLCTNISVLHDIRALEPLKETLPQLYSEIDSRATVSDAGKLYLLDSMRGYQNV
jgi:hypothetical protein